MAEAKIHKYGVHFDEIEKQIYTPEYQQKEWGFLCHAIENPDYNLDQFFIKNGKTCSINLKDYAGKEVIIYLIEGELNIPGIGTLKPENTVFFPTTSSLTDLQVQASRDSYLYLFFGPSYDEKITDKDFLKGETYDRRNKPWAENLIETVINRHFTGKQIFYEQGNNCSFHFHCQKTETYFIHSGKLLLQLRAGHAEDRYYVLGPGQAVKITPGLMHRVGALTDVKIVESSTHDVDTDGFMVEDEFSDMPTLQQRIYQPEQFK